jgi:DNA (cytosine-5)-methyltransferase 1
VKNSSKVIFKLGELFSGPGGLAYGAKLARVSNRDIEYSVEPIWANDIDPDACKTYIRNIHPSNPNVVLCKPVEQILVDNLPDIDALAFGFPCNDFSVVGERKGINGKYGSLYTYGVNVLNKKNPNWFIAENVGGIKNANNGETFIKIIDELQFAGKGYHITAHLYKFEEYGIPQFRHRVIIVGIRKDLGLIFKVPAPITPGNYVSVKDALEVPPIPLDASNNEFTNQSNAVIERLKFIPPGENAWYDGIPNELKLKVRGAKLSQIYKRLDPNKPAYTITGSGGGGTHVYHWVEHRALTNRERARIQTFPDSFIFEGSKESVRKQIGMAVPPKASKLLVESILKTFAGMQYEHIDASLVNVIEEEQVRVPTQVRLPEFV